MKTIISLGLFCALLSVFPIFLEAQIFKTITIGDRVWMSENYNQEVPGSWCYDNNPENCKKYGRLYTYEAAIKILPQRVAFTYR